MSRDIYAFFDGNKEVDKFKIHADDKENVLIHITLKDFSFQSSKRIFFRFIFAVGYIGMNSLILNIQKLALHIYSLLLLMVLME